MNYEIIGLPMLDSVDTTTTTPTKSAGDQLHEIFVRPFEETPIKAAGLLAVIAIGVCLASRVKNSDKPWSNFLDDK